MIKVHFFKKVELFKSFRTKQYCLEVTAFLKQLRSHKLKTGKYIFHFLLFMLYFYLTVCEYIFEITNISIQNKV